MSLVRTASFQSLTRELGTSFLTREAWQDWTPTVTQSAAVTVTITYARYAIFANTVLMQVRLEATSAGVANNPISIAGVPTAIQPANTPGSPSIIGHGMVTDTGTAFYVGALVAVGANDFRMIAHNAGTPVGQTPNFALANGDFISFIATYER